MSTTTSTSTTMVEIATADGPCATELIVPAGAGPWPVVVLCTDVAGQREAMTEIAERIAVGGYLVATPDLYHRSGQPGRLLPPGTEVTLATMRALFTAPKMRARYAAEFYEPAIDHDNLRTTIGALLDHLAARHEVTGKVGTTGYCMGGNASFRIATVLGDRITATAAFHPGGLVTDQPNSPHLRSAQIRSRVLIAGASDDPTFSDAAKATLSAALDDAKVTYTIETYPAKHGFAVRDNVPYDPACAERHFAALAALFGETLR